MTLIDKHKSEIGIGRIDFVLYISAGRLSRPPLMSVQRHTVAAAGRPAPLSTQTNGRMDACQLL